MRHISDLERYNIEFLVRLDISFGLLEQTTTTLGKAYSDATQEFREFLVTAAIHDYARQHQGQEYKVLRNATVIAHGSLLASEIAMYRPRTKKGDPRIRISKIKEICHHGDIAVVMLVEDELYIFRLDEYDLEAEVDRPSVLRRLLGRTLRQRTSASQELLSLMYDLAGRGFIKTHRSGDTAVGHLLESELGITANSSKAPDYKGIEIKSTRAKSQRRHTMFARVPDWEASSIASTAQFLYLFGYDRRGFPELNCEVRADRANSLGLRLRVSSDEQFLEEFSEVPEKPLALRWTLESLRTSLKRKHAETFWVKATSQLRPDGEYVRFDRVIHTSRPVLQQVAPLLEAGEISVDHLISKRPDRSVKEQGPLFKISDRYFDALFPTIEVHQLH